MCARSMLRVTSRAAVTVSYLEERARDAKLEAIVKCTIIALYDHGRTAHDPFSWSCKATVTAICNITPAACQGQPEANAFRNA